MKSERSRCPLPLEENREWTRAHTHTHTHTLSLTHTWALADWAARRMHATTHTPPQQLHLAPAWFTVWQGSTHTRTNAHANAHAHTHLRTRTWRSHGHASARSHTHVHTHTHNTHITHPWTRRHTHALTHPLTIATGALSVCGSGSSVATTSASLHVTPMAIQRTQPL
jgi:hypothetical protein